MGEVFRARDTKLGREVALKVLPPAFASDPERLARFDREAKTLAALNHSNVAQIYGVEESSGATAIVMELVDGESLDRRIARGKLPIDEALDIARQMADALEAAHEHGIIHRDLKPANIAVTHDGRVKVLDFGLAKAIEPVGSTIDVMNSPTITSPAMLSGVGMILGTAAYMSPEQAKGRPADKRSDVWAFGCVCFEMLTGARPFAGDDVTETLAHVLRGEPDWTALPADLPQSTVALIKGCLVKDRAKRVADLAAARFVLGGWAENGDTGAPGPRAKPSTAAALVPAVIGLALGGAIVGAAMWSARPKPVPTPTVRFSIGIPEAAGGTSQPSISADGSKIVFPTEDRLYIRSLSDLDAHPVAGTEGAGSLSYPVFSPDGRDVAFFSWGDHSIKRISVDGGVPQTLCSLTNAAALSWSPTGIIFMTLSNGVLRVPATGGEPEVLVPHRREEFARWPRLLPDGRTLIYSASPSTRLPSAKPASIVAQPIGGAPKTLIGSGGSNARYLPTGHLAYVANGVLMAAPFDLRSLTVTGPAVPVLEGIRRSAVTADAQFDISENGSVVYVEGPAAGAGPVLSVLGTLDASDTLNALHLPPAAYDHPRVSPDGKRLVYSIEDGKDTAVWVYEMSGGSPPRRLTFQGANRYPVWSVDGERVVFQSDRDGASRMYWQRADGSDRAVPLTKMAPAPGTVEIPNAWSADGKILMYTTSKDLTFGLATVRVADGTTEPFGDLHSLYPPTPAISPDGRWVAYGSWEGAGNGGIFIEPFPRTGAAKYQVSRGSGIQPMWSRDGKQLVYAPEGNTLLSVPLTTQPFALGNPVKLPRHGISTLGPDAQRRYDYTADGKILGIFPPTAGAAAVAPPEYKVVLHWFDVLTARVAASTQGRQP
jgi:serine/threonine-protein kinase